MWGLWSWIYSLLIGATQSGTTVIPQQPRRASLQCSLISVDFWSHAEKNDVMDWFVNQMRPLDLMMFPWKRCTQFCCLWQLGGRGKGTWEWMWLYKLKIFYLTQGSFTAESPGTDFWLFGGKKRTASLKAIEEEEGKKSNLNKVLYYAKKSFCHEWKLRFLLICNHVSKKLYDGH